MTCEADQPTLEELRDPRRDGYVGLAAGYVVDVLGVVQPDLKLSSSEW